jgi:hypothetical protein
MSNVQTHLSNISQPAVTNRIYETHHSFNLYHKQKGDLNPVLWGCWQGFNSIANSLAVH